MYLKRIKKFSVQQELVDLLQSLPVLVGVGIRSDVVGVEDAYTMLTGNRVELPKYIDLGPLALAAGWGSELTNMPIIAAVTLGMVMNKNRVGRRLNLGRQVDGNFQVPESYCLGDIKMGHLAYIILVAVLMRDLFPDRDIVSLLGSCAEEPFTEWFCSWIRMAMIGTEVYHPALVQAGTRAELLEAVRFRDDRGRISETPPARVKAIIPLLGGWPTLPHGGPRFLHQVRVHAVDQFRYLGTNENSRDETFFQDTWDAELMKLVRFGLEGLENVDWSVPATDLNPGLSYCSGIRQSSFLIDPPNMKYTDTQVQATRTGRPQKEGVLEWIRLYPWRYQDLILKMMEEETFLTRFEQYYESMRLQYYRATGGSNQLIPVLESKIAEQNAAFVEKLEKEAHEAQLELIMRRTRVAEVEFKVSQGIFINRCGWEHWITPTTKRPVIFIPRTMPRYVPIPAPAHESTRDRSSGRKLQVGREKSERAGPSSGRDRVRSRSTDRGRKRRRSELEDSDWRTRRRRSTTPFATTREKGDPELILDPTEHRSCGKYVSSKGKGKGKSAPARKVTQDEYEEQGVQFILSREEVDEFLMQTP